MENETDSKTRELMEKYVLLRTKKDQFEAQLSPVNIDLEAVKNEIIKHLDDLNIKTVKYEDLGAITVKAPKPRPSFEQENKPAVWEFLKKNGGADCIKEGIHAATFSSFVTELLEKGIAIPAFIDIFYQPTLTYTAPKK